MVRIDLEADAWSGEVRAAGAIRGTGRRSPKTVGEKAPESGDVRRQVEGIGRLSIIPGPSSRAGRCGTFEGEKRKFLSVTGADKILSLYTEGVGGQSVNVGFTAAADTWTEITVTLGELGDPATISRLNFFNNTGSAIGMVTFDEIRLEAAQGSGLFSDGFETGDTSAWSATAP